MGFFRREWNDCLTKIGNLKAIVKAAKKCDLDVFPTVRDLQAFLASPETYCVVWPVFRTFSFVACR